MKTNNRNILNSPKLAKFMELNNSKEYEDLTIGEKVKFHRLLLGLTLQEIANRSNSTKSYIWEIENGKSIPSFPKMVKLAKAIQVTINCFEECPECKE